MAQQWPTTAPSVEPTIHSYAATQAYQAGGGDYFRSGYYSHGLYGSGAMTTQALTLDRLYVRPFLVPVRRAFDRIGVNVTTASAAASGGLLRMGIFTIVDGLPDALVLDAGTVSSESTTGGKEITIAQTLDPGMYGLGVVAQVVTCTITRYIATTFAPWTWEAAPPGASSATVFVPTYNGRTGALASLAGVTPNSTLAQFVAVSLRAT